MARTTVSGTLVVVDDEMQHLTWLLDYLYSKGFEILPVDNANDAIDQTTKEVYRALIIDLNIPILPPLEQAAASLGGVYVRYPGLFVARHARNSGYRDRQVVIYSVHKDPDVINEAKKLGCTYILKGRPREIMDELRQVLAFDPTDVGRDEEYP